MRQIKTDLRGKNAGHVLQQAMNTHSMMQGNPHFPAPVPSLAELEAACNDLQESIVATEMGGNKLAFATKQTRLAVLSQVLKNMAAYVSIVANGDAQIMLSAGFNVRRPSIRITEMEAPRELRASTGTLACTIDLRWRPVHGARMYRVFIGNGAGENWRMLTMVSNSRFRATDLDPLTYYSFKVEALGTEITSPVSNTARALSIGNF